MSPRTWNFIRFYLYQTRLYKPRNVYKEMRKTHTILRTCVFVSCMDIALLLWTWIWNVLRHGVQEISSQGIEEIAVERNGNATFFLPIQVARTFEQTRASR